MSDGMDRLAWCLLSDIGFELFGAFGYAGGQAQLRHEDAVAGCAQHLRYPREIAAQRQTTNFEPSEPQQAVDQHNRRTQFRKGRVILCTGPLAIASWLRI